MILKSTNTSQKPSSQFSRTLKKAAPWAPHSYQKRATRFLIEHGGAGLFLDPGLGKTSISLAAVKILKKEGFIKRTLVIAPLRVCYSVWPKEILKWDNFKDLKIVILHGKDKLEKLDEDADIFIINPEGLAWLTQTNRMARLNCDTLIVDESSKFKKTSTKRFKQLKPFLPKFKRRWILTGSPAPNGLMDLFGQIYILDLGKSLSPYITHFRQNYFIPTGYGGYEWKLKPGAEKAINEVINPLVLRLDAKDYLELPDIVANNIVVTLPPDARKVYDDIEDDLITEFDGGRTVTAATAASASMKCRQIASGGLYYNDLNIDDENSLMRLWHHIHDEKTDVVEDLVEEMQGRPLLIAYEFEHSLDRLLKRFGKDTPYIGGGVSGKKSLQIEAGWNAGRIPLLLGQWQSMAHGLNMQESECHTIGCYDLTWNYELYDQFIKRIARQGSRHRKVFVHHIVAEDTIDEAQVYAVKGKGKVQTNFLNALKEYVKGRKQK